MAYDKAKRRAEYLRNKRDPTWVERERAKDLARKNRRYRTDPAAQEKIKAGHYRRYWKDPEKARAYKRQLTYGVTPQQFRSLLDRQGGRCAICRTDHAGLGRDWHVDHDHKTGAVRGLLCTHCNFGLGHFKDDPARIQRAAKYLELAEFFS